MEFEESYFSSRHGRIHYTHHKGTGNSIIFLHGFAGSIKTWTRLMERLPDGLDIFLVDLLGHGASDSPDIDYTLQMHYECLSDFVDNLTSGHPVLFGHSYGGWLAAYYAAEKGNLSGLVLEDSSGIKEFHEERITANPEFREQMIRNGMELNPRENVLRSMLGTDNTEEYLTRSRLEAIDSRTMVIWGAQDITVNVKYADWFRNHIRNCRVEILPNEKHTPHYTNPEAVARLLIDFQKKL